MTKENIREILIERNIKRASFKKSINQGKKELDNNKKKRRKGKDPNKQKEHREGKDGS